MSCRRTAGAKDLRAEVFMGETEDRRLGDRRQKKRGRGEEVAGENGVIRCKRKFNNVIQRTLLHLFMVD